MDGLREGRGVIVSVIGEAGIGKTRLVSEVRREYGDVVRFIEGRAVSYAQSFPYSPIRDLLRDWLRVGASTPETRVRLELKAQLAELFGDDAEDAYVFLANLLGLTLEPDAAEKIRELNRESVQHQTIDVFADLLRRLAEELPLCVILEDLHWADEATLELLEEALGVTEEAAVGLMFLYRTEREHLSWRLGERARQMHPHRYREIELRPLPGDASRTLVDGTADGELPEAVADLLVERAGGNPFFLEEALRDLVERGALRRANGSWELAVEPDELAVPALVQGALQARLDRLEPATREVVSLAAVIGRTFGVPLLEKLVPHDELRDALVDLQRLDLIVETRRRPTPEYRFRHGLVQEVAYSTLVEPTRRSSTGASARRSRISTATRSRRSTTCSRATSARPTSRRRPSTTCSPPATRPAGSTPTRRRSATTARRGPSSPASATSAARGTRSSRWRSPTTWPPTSSRPRRPTTRRSAAASRTRPSTS